MDCVICNRPINHDSKVMVWLGLEGQKHLWCALEETGDDVRWEANQDKGKG